MQIVERPTLSPSCCAITKKAGVECFDLLRDFDFDHQGRFYISTSVVRDMARMLGLVEPDTRAEETIQELLVEIKDLEVKLSEQERFLQAIDVLESREFRARRKPGRPKEKTSA